MDAAVRALVLRRAGNRCEYCLLRQEQLPFSTFHIEHIIPRKHGGDDEPANLVLACNRCNSHKGANLTGVDPETGEITALFNPRQHSWEEHFRLSDIVVVGLTPVGPHHSVRPQHERRTPCPAACCAQAGGEPLKSSDG